MCEGKTWRKIKNPYTSRVYEKELLELYEGYISSYPCCHCGHPVLKGYCCSTCGSGDPQGDNR